MQRVDNVKKNYDVIVCGGGPAGFAAAVSAARRGAKTLLIERSGCLGGIWTSGLLCWVLDIENKCSEGILKEMFDELTACGAGNLFNTGRGMKFSCDVEAMKHYLEQKCTQCGVDLLYHTSLCGAETENGEIKYILTASKSGVERFSARVYIDATGDGDLGALCGCSFKVGTEEGKTQPMSLIALVGGLNPDEIREFNNGLTIEGVNPKKRLLEEMLRAGITPSYTEPTLMQLSDYVFALMSNHEYSVSADDAEAITRATVHARHELNETVKALRALGGVWKNIHLISTAENIGVRDGRRIDGLYYLTADDLFEGRCFEDAICKVGNKIDVHSTDADDNGGVVQMNRLSEPYEIPMRSLIARDNSSLLMAGRCISGDFYAHSTFRLTGNAVTTGCASGVLAAAAVKSNKPPKAVSYAEFKAQLSC